MFVHGWLFRASIALLLTCGSASAQEPTIKRNPLTLIVPADTEATTYNWPSEEGPRDVIVFRPADRSLSGDFIVVNHALGMNAVSMANLTGLGARAAQTGAVIAFSTGLGARFNIDLDSSTDLDVNHLADVVARAPLLFGTDPARSFMAGYSNGATMAAIVACRRPDLLAGLAMVAGTLDVRTAAGCDPARQLSVLTFHGTNDRLIPYTGVRSSIGAIGVFDFFRERSGCSETRPVELLPNRELLNATVVESLTAAGCAGGAVVQHFKVTRGGHSWPDSDFAFFNLQSGTTTRDVNASDEIARFFARAPSNPSVLPGPQD